VDGVLRRARLHGVVDQGHRDEPAGRGGDAADGPLDDELPGRVGDVLAGAGHGTDGSQPDRHRPSRPSAVRRTLVAVEDQQILARVHELVAEEHKLREGGPGLSAEARERLQQLERDLDQCWDVLRQRRARREFGENPDDAAVRPSGEVEGYLQ
jgi:hypothetical protein